MFGEIAVAGGATAASVLAWGVRGRSSTLLAPSVWRGPSGRRAIALTFDDGPSESTPRLLELLARYGASATFFECGVHVRRLPGIARAVHEAGHETGNHTDTHAALYLRSRRFLTDQLQRAQQTIEDTIGIAPGLFRATYGARWFGLRRAQRELGLTGVMWTVIARDWTLPAQRIAARLRAKVAPGSIVCLHDGRELAVRPDIQSTLDALAAVMPYWSGEGYDFVTVSDLLCLPTRQNA